MKHLGWLGLVVWLVAGCDREAELQRALEQRDVREKVAAVYRNLKTDNPKARTALDDVETMLTAHAGMLSQPQKERLQKIRHALQQMVAALDSGDASSSARWDRYRSNWTQAHLGSELLLKELGAAAH